MASYIKSVKWTGSNGEEHNEQGNINISGTYLNGASFSNRPLGDLTINGAIYTRLEDDIDKVVVDTFENGTSFIGDSGSSVAKTYPISYGFGSGTYSVDNITISNDDVVSASACVSDSDISVSLECFGDYDISGSGHFYVYSNGYGVHSNGVSGTISQSQYISISYQFTGSTPTPPSPIPDGYDGYNAPDSILILHCVGNDDYPAPGIDDGGGGESLAGLWYNNLLSAVQEVSSADAYSTEFAWSFTSIIDGWDKNAILDGTIYNPLIVMVGNVGAKQGGLTPAEWMVDQIWKTRNGEGSELDDYQNWVTSLTSITFLVVGDKLPNYTSESMQKMVSINAKVVGIDVTVPIEAFNTLLTMNSKPTYMPDGNQYTIRYPYSLTIDGEYQTAICGNVSTIETIQSSAFLYEISGVQVGERLTFTNSVESLNPEAGTNSICTTTAVSDTSGIYPFVFHRLGNNGCLSDNAFLSDYFSNVILDYAPLKWFTWTTDSVNNYTSSPALDNTSYGFNYSFDSTSFAASIGSGSGVFEDGRYSIFDVYYSLLENGAITGSNLVPSTGAGAIIIDNYGINNLYNMLNNTGSIGDVFVLSVNTNAAQIITNVVKLLDSSNGAFPFVNLLYEKKVAYGYPTYEHEDDEQAYNYYHFILQTGDGENAGPSYDASFIEARDSMKPVVVQYYLPVSISQIGKGTSVCPYFLSDTMLTATEWDGTHNQNVVIDYVI